MMSVLGVADLCLVHQVALGKDGAAGGDGGGILALQGNLAELLHLHAQAPRLAGQETAGAGCAERVHGVIHHDAVLNQDDLGILAADLKDRAHIRIQGGGAHRMGGDLVLDHHGAQHGAHQFAGAAGGAGGHI